MKQLILIYKRKILYIIGVSIALFGLLLFPQYGVIFAGMLGVCLSFLVFKYTNLHPTFKSITSFLIIFISLSLGFFILNAQRDFSSDTQALSPQINTSFQNSQSAFAREVLDPQKVNLQYTIAGSAAEKLDIDTQIEKHEDLFSKIDLTTRNIASFRVSNVLSATTIELEEFGIVQLLGLNNPLSSSNATCFEDIAINRITEITTGKKVYLEFDSSARYDFYGRVLAYVYLEGGYSINTALLEDGYVYAIDSSISDHYRNDQFTTLEREARLKPTGVWVDDVCQTVLLEDKNVDVSNNSISSQSFTSVSNIAQSSQSLESSQNSISSISSSSTAQSVSSQSQNSNQTNSTQESSSTTSSVTSTSRSSIEFSQSSVISSSAQSQLTAQTFAKVYDVTYEGFECIRSTQVNTQYHQVVAVYLTYQECNMSL